MEHKFKVGDVIRLADPTSITVVERTYYLVKSVDIRTNKVYDLYHIYSGTSYIRSVYHTDRAYEKVV